MKVNRNEESSLKNPLMLKSAANRMRGQLEKFKNSMAKSYQNYRALDCLNCLYVKIKANEFRDVIKANQNEESSLKNPLMLRSAANRP